MARKIPNNAFDLYLGLGPGRSYEAVAGKLGVSKRAITRKATSERWQDRVAEIERKARDLADEKAVESIEAVNSRHIRIVKAVQAKALAALRDMPLDSAMDAVRALDMTLKQERIVRGEPTDRTVVSVEDVVKREYSRWLTSGSPDDS